MKNFSIILILLVSMIGGNVHATDVDLEGYWSFNIKKSRKYSYSGYSMSGSRSRLGRGYYRYGSLSGGSIENNDSTAFYSGSLSLEFWRLNYYGGSTGTVLFTRGFDGLDEGYLYSDVYRSGYFRSPGRYGYGDISLAEYDGYDWTESDDIPFAKYKYF